MIDRHADVTVPDWNVVHFEVGCARCGHDLRGLTEPKCPACGLEFDWSKAVPIEQLICRKCGYHLYGLRDTRCPECGESFTWEQALDDHHRRQKPLFEYRWRDHPFRSFMYTWWLALRPWKLWRTVDIHDPPRPVMLGVMVSVSAIVFILAGVLPGTLAWVVDDLKWRQRWTASGAMMPSLLSRLPSYLKMSFYDQLDFALTIGIWAVFSFFALLVFQQSMRIYKVRTKHVFRVWIFSVVMLSPPACFAYSMTLSTLRMLNVRYFDPTETSIAAACSMILVLYSGIAIIFAYKRYLHLPHSAGVAIASQIIALLSSTIVSAIVCTALIQSPSGVFLRMLIWSDNW